MKTPAFQFYPAEFLVDENVVMMSNQELGCYIKLMCYCWREDSIPSDIGKIARLCGEDGSAMAQLWTTISLCFESAIADESRLVHPRLDKERIKQKKFKEERSESGKKGANSKWNKEITNNGSAINKPMAEPMAEPMAKDGSLSLSLSLSSIDTAQQKKRATRLSDGWVLPDGWGNWALDEKLVWGRDDVVLEAKKFRDYWHAKAGRDAAKLDWEATWRNWVRNSREVK